VAPFLASKRQLSICLLVPLSPTWFRPSPHDSDIFAKDIVFPIIPSRRVRHMSYVHLGSWSYRFVTYHTLNFLVCVYLRLRKRRTLTIPFLQYVYFSSEKLVLNGGCILQSGTYSNASNKGAYPKSWFMYLGNLLFRKQEICRKKWRHFKKYQPFVWLTFSSCRFR
jgi:hypothetical protein